MSDNLRYVTPVLLSTVKNYMVYFGQKNRENSLLKVVLGVVFRQ